LRTGDNRARALLRTVERAAYLPLLARLPSALGYRMARQRGDWQFRSQAARRAEVAHNLQLVFGDELSPAAVQQVTQEWFRLASCEMVDIKRLRHKGRALRRLVEIRGREHLEAALAAGRGAILCSGHFGSYNCGFSVLHASGFPVTGIGRLWYRYEGDLSSGERRLWEFYFRPVWRHRQRPNIEPFPGRPEVAALTVAALRANEVVAICIDAAPMDSDRGRAVEAPFLGRRATLLPGIVRLAEATGAPVLMGFLYRAADYRHQVLEISAPMPVKGDTATAFGRCAAEVSAAIRRSPAHWETWSKTDQLVDLGLIPSQRGGSPAAGPILVPPGRILHDGSPDAVAAHD
jgi:lauroyl/myristoyl acyltransferase